tara:strand:+ start:26649 stop:27122 length:474 start_codon:yes stop_codon:yes gene_type:complete
MELPKNLKNDILDFCRANDITDIDTFIVGLVKTAFTIEKYGYSPESGELAKPIEIEVVKEVIKEVIREVPVDRIVKVTDNIETDKLLYQLEDSKSMRLAGAKVYQEEKDKMNSEIERLTKTIAEQIEQIDKMSKADGRDIYGEKRIIGKLGSNLLDN